MKKLPGLEADAGPIQQDLSALMNALAHTLHDVLARLEARMHEGDLGSLIRAVAERDALLDAAKASAEKDAEIARQVGELDALYQNASYQTIRHWSGEAIALAVERDALKAEVARLREALALAQVSLINSAPKDIPTP